MHSFCKRCFDDSHCKPEKPVARPPAPSKTRETLCVISPYSRKMYYPGHIEFEKWLKERKKNFHDSYEQLGIMASYSGTILG